MAGGNRPADPAWRDAAEPYGGDFEETAPAPPARRPQPERAARRDDESCDRAPPPADDPGLKDEEEPPVAPADAAGATADADEDKPDAPAPAADAEFPAMPMPMPVSVPLPLPGPTLSLPGTAPLPEGPAAGGATAGAGYGLQPAADASSPPDALPLAENAGAPAAVSVEQQAEPVRSSPGPLVVPAVQDETATVVQVMQATAALATAAPGAQGAGTGAATVNEAGDATAAVDAIADAQAGGDVETAVALPQAAEGGDAGFQDGKADPGQDFAGGSATGQAAVTGRVESGRAEPNTQRTPASQLAEPLVRAARAGVQRVEIALEPAALGRVDVRLDFAGDGRMNALIVADSRQALDALRADAQTLTRALADAGIDAGGLNFGLRQREPGSDSGSFASAFGRSGGSGGPGPGDGGPPAAARVSGPYPSPAGRLDIRA